MLTPEQPA